MAVRSVVLSPPVPPRQSVILRAGAAPGQGKARDAVIGIVGALLLVSTVWLAVALPVKEVLPSQYKVSFPVVPDAREKLDFDFTNVEGSRIHDFEYESPGDNVYQIDVVTSFEDDVPASEPDRFLIQLFDPNGDQVSTDYFVANVDGVQDPNFPLQYNAVGFGQIFSFSLPNLKPRDTIVQVPTNTSAVEIERAQEAKNHAPTSGTFKLRITLVQVGDCPIPAPGSVPSPEDLEQASACQEETRDQGNHDVGNSFTVGSFTFQRFEPLAEKLS